MQSACTSSAPPTPTSEAVLVVLALLYEFGVVQRARVNVDENSVA